jgi:hypothetical protein
MEEIKPGSLEFTRIYKDWEAALQELATKSLAGDKEAKQELDTNSAVDALINKCDMYLSNDYPDNGCGFDSDQCSVRFLKAQLLDARDVKCITPFKEVGDLSTLAPIGDVVEENGKHYVPTLDDYGADSKKFTGAEYGVAVEDALKELEEGKVVTLFNGVQVLKDKLGLHKVIKRQLNKARTMEELIEVLDKQNGMNVRCQKWTGFTHQHPEVLVDAFAQVLNYFSDVKIEDT